MKMLESGVYNFENKHLHNRFARKNCARFECMERLSKLENKEEAHDGGLKLHYSMYLFLSILFMFVASFLMFVGMIDFCVLYFSFYLVKMYEVRKCSYK